MNTISDGAKESTIATTSMSTVSTKKESVT